MCRYVGRVVQLLGVMVSVLPPTEENLYSQTKVSRDIIMVYAVLTPSSYKCLVGGCRIRVCMRPGRYLALQFNPISAPRQGRR
jgi:hypothetical protein